jgi:hypothetical protein
VPDVLQGGAEGRAPHRGGRVAGALVVALLAGAAVWQVANGSGGGAAPEEAHRPAASPAPVAVSPAPPSPTMTASVVQVPAATSRAPRTLPWSRLPTGAPLSADAAAGRYIVVGGRTRDLGDGARVVTMDRAAAGPVLLVQEPDAVSLEQLRPGGARLVLDQFSEERRLPQGIAVDPAGRFVAYGLASVVPGSNSLVVRDLRTGAATVRLRTREPFMVSDWTRAGVVLEVAKDPGGPPYLWQPSPDRPRRLVGFARGSSGPFLLASAPGRAAWVVTRPEPGCVDVVVGVPGVIRRGECEVSLSDPAAWSTGGDLVAARGNDGGLRLFDVRNITVTRLRSGRAEVRQVAWSPEHTVLAAVTDRTGEHHAVLRCYLGGECERVPLPRGFGSEDIVLAR